MLENVRRREFLDNSYTIEGTNLHERVHTVGAGNREEIWQIRAIWLKSDNYRLIGKADLIESHDGEFIPVEYKRGSKGEWDNDELQVCAQAMCLEEMTGKSARYWLYLLCQFSPASTSGDRSCFTATGESLRSEQLKP
ncbi:MAG UNVERIFIED_CONTAM: CRISPR-associated protein Cas4 [Microcystis novacekii LVE1205-3]